MHILLAMLLALPRAQGAGTIAGTVSDAAGGVLPGATIALTDAGGGPVAVTNVSGHYELSVPAAGTYHVIAVLSGFRSETTDVTVASGRTVESNPVLRTLVLPTDDVEVFLRPFVGLAALDCGRVARAARLEELDAAVKCALDARSRRQPFVTSQRPPGIDSIVEKGLLGTSDGTLFAYAYDSRPCGGPGCSARFTVEVCRRPVATQQGGAPAIHCDPPRELNDAQALRLRRRPGGA